MERYGASVAAVCLGRRAGRGATEIFRSDLDAGYITVLVEMIAGASSTPGLGRRGRRPDRTVEGVRPDGRSRTRSAAHRSAALPPKTSPTPIVALYLGLEMLSHLDGDRQPALALFAHAKQLAGLFEAMTGPSPRRRTHDRHSATTTTCRHAPTLGSTW